ncbi:MAG: rod shape-determining protein MreC [Clostridiales bacterium]|nr:rod shape-determining protein MreC [Clostridiales bacterium]
MKDFFHSKSFKLLIAVVFILLGLMLYTASSGGSLTETLLGFLSTPMQRVSTVVTNNAATAATNASLSKEELLAKISSLESENAELRSKLINYYTYQQQNAQLLKYYQLKKDNPDLKLTAAAVIGRDPNDLFYGFQIDRGKSSGIALNDPVITENGVVGWISSVNASYSRVTTLLSPDTKISAIDKVNRDSGVVSTNLKMADQGLVKLGYLSADTTVKAGDIIVTSGIGGIYPRDLAIGTVKKVGHETTDVSLYAEVTPFVDVKTVRDVMVITYFNGQGQALDDGTSSSSSSSSSSSASSSASSGTD